jgi:very-short-patch-repair endonuclease
MTAVPGGRASLDVRRPFTRADAVAHGITDRELAGPGFDQLFRGVHIAATVEVTPLLRAEGALLLFPPGAHASHATAARIYRLPIPVMPLEHVTVVRAADRRRREGIRCGVRADAVVRVVEGVRVSAPEQVFLDLASELPLVDLVVVGDHLVRTGLVRLGRLREFCRTASGAGAAQARAAAAYVRDRVDSPMETRLRMLIVLAGLPEPQVNLTFGDEDALQLRRYDLCWPEARLIVEYDGRHHIEREDQWVADLARREQIEDDSWRIIVLTARDIYTTPGRTVERIHRLLRQRGMKGTPKQPSPRWRPHFPGRD